MEPTKAELRYQKLRAWQKTTSAMIKQIQEEMLPRVSSDTAAKLHHASNALFQADSSLNAAANQIARES